ncbi:MAG TPA: hypothetical protein VK034_11075 [Enhygromyxa sp.]|nr:hypothetical protein [Enhygromyxa sp.]
MSADALDARWDGFLAKIRERFDELMRESEAGCAELLKHTGGDTVPLSNAWQGMRMRALGLQSKIGDTWSESVQDKFHEIEAYDRADAAWARAEAVSDQIEIDLERIETKIFADALRSMLSMAAQEQAALRCSQCGAELPVGVVLAVTEVNCRHCGALNTIEPGPRARMAVALSHYLWQEACWPKWLARWQAENAAKRARNVTLAQLQAWEAAEIDYWTAWLHERAKLMPNTARDFDKELRGRLHQFYGSLEREPAWFKAGAPRRVPPM